MLIFSERRGGNVKEFSSMAQSIKRKFATSGVDVKAIPIRRGTALNLAKIYINRILMTSSNHAVEGLAMPLIEGGGLHRTRHQRNDMSRETHA